MSINERFSSPLSKTFKCLAESMVPIYPIVKNAGIIKNYLEKFSRIPDDICKKPSKRKIIHRSVASALVQTSTLGALGLGTALAIGVIASNPITLGLFAACAALFLIGFVIFYLMNRQFADMT